MHNNNLLRSLPRVSGAALFPGLKQLELTFGQVLHDTGKRIDHVYFPTDSLVSLLSHARDQNPVELGVIGRDGMVGVAIALGDGVAGSRAVVQAAGTALRATPADFMKAFARRPRMRRDVRRYCNDLTNQVMQTASCNRNHNPEQRLARWLLMMRDRLSTDRYTLTQQYLGYMLGVRRAAVSEAAGRLQQRRLIRYARGSIQILDARKLKAAACGCYRAWVEELRPR